MPTVTGGLTDFSTYLPPELAPRVVFVPSSPAISGSLFLATRPVVVDVAADGTFSATLFSNDATSPATWYTVRLEWLVPNLYGNAGGYRGLDLPDFKITVPSFGGPISTMVTSTSAPSALLVEWGPTAPDPWPIGLVWVDTTTGDVIRKTA